MYMKVFFNVFLIQWTVINSVAIQSTHAVNPTKLTILYLTDTPFTEQKDKLFTEFLQTISNSTGENTRVEVRTKQLPNNLTTMLPVLRILNSSMVWEETGIIILDVEEGRLKTLSLFSSIGVVFDVKTRPLTEKTEYSNTLVAKPSLIRLHSAVKQIFGEIGWTTMAEVECLSDNHSDIATMRASLDEIRQSASTFIFVKCLNKLDIILRYAKETGLTGSAYRWVFPGIIDLDNISVYLPKNVIAIDLPGAMERHDSATTKHYLFFLKDVLKVLEIILRENSQKFTSENEWSWKRFIKTLKRYIINRKFPGYTGDVIFDEEGRRRGEHYEIFELITFNGKYQWLAIGSLEQGNVKILFNQWRLDKQLTNEIPVLRVVTYYKYPWVVYASEKYPDTLGICVIGRVCRRYTNRSDVSKYKDYCCIGLIIDLLNKLQRETKFKGVLHIVKDGKFGSNDPKTNQWNGMIGEVVRGEADMALSSLTITAKRSKVVDFTYPYLDAANGILVSTEPAVHTLWDFKFLDTFSGPLWLALFITVQIVIIIIWIAERLRKRRRFVNNPYKRDNSISYAEIINYTYSLVFQKASEEVGPSTLGGRTVAALFAFGTIIICSSFTANLAAIQVTERAGISISGIHDSKFQNPSSDFTFGTIADSANLDFFRDSDDPALQRIYHQIKKNLVTTSEKGSENVASRKWSAYIDDIPQLAYFVSKQTDCTLKIVGDPFFFSGYGIALPKNSTWNAPLSLVITELVREGFIGNLQSKWLVSACGDSKQVGIEKMGLNDIGGAFLIVAFGCVASGVLLIVEVVVWKIIKILTKDEDNKELKRSQRLCSLAKAFTLFDIDQGGKPVLHAEATLRNFRSFPLVQRHHGNYENEGKDLEE